MFLNKRAGKKDRTEKEKVKKEEKTEEKASKKPLDWHVIAGKLGILAVMCVLILVIIMGQRLSNYILGQEVSGRTSDAADGENQTDQNEKMGKSEGKNESNGDNFFVILDPGHGESDSGKVGVNGVLEKDVNLIIASKVNRLLEERQIDTAMTRTTDTTTGQSKMDDMRARVDMINKSEADMVVSIHQNSYTAESVHGAQVFYHTQSEEGKKAALIMQEALLAADTDNTRQAKADSSYYMLKKTKKPLIIVECGFLSNWAEAKLLTSEEYQEKMAEAICEGIVDYLRLAESK